VKRSARQEERRWQRQQPAATRSRSERRPRSPRSSWLSLRSQKSWILALRLVRRIAEKPGVRDRSCLECTNDLPNLQTLAPRGGKERSSHTPFLKAMSALVSGHWTSITTSAQGLEERLAALLRTPCTTASAVPPARSLGT